MSFDRQTIILKLTENIEQLTDHLIKLYLFPNTDYTSHWKKEIWNFLNRVPIMSASKKLPPYKLIYESISGYLDRTEDLMYFILDEYSEHIPERVDAQELESYICNYLKWLADQLATKGLVTSKEVYAKLDEIGF